MKPEELERLKKIADAAQVVADGLRLLANTAGEARAPGVDVTPRTWTRDRMTGVLTPEEWENLPRDWQETGLAVSPWEWLMSAFTWGDTAQGVEYWETVADRLRQGAAP